MLKLMFLQHVQYKEFGTSVGIFCNGCDHNHITNYWGLKVQFKDRKRQVRVFRCLPFFLYPELSQKSPCFTGFPQFPEQSQSNLSLSLSLCVFHVYEHEKQLLFSSMTLLAPDDTASYVKYAKGFYFVCG